MKVIEKESTITIEKEITQTPLNNYENNSRTDILTIFGISTFIFILILLIVFCTFSIINKKNQNIATGIYVKGINISGLTKEQAKNKISEYINSSIPEEIKLQYNNIQTEIPTSQLSVYFNVEEAIEIAYQIGKSGNMFQNNLAILQALLSKINIEPGFSIDEKQLKLMLEDISNKLPNKVIESNYYIDDNNLIITKRSEEHTSELQSH